jgi:hypothetical protein
LENPIGGAIDLSDFMIIGVSYTQISPLESYASIFNLN